jgi:hypothetical protein
MKITIESTEEIVGLGPDGCVHARLWKGTTETGANVIAIVALIGIDGKDPNPAPDLLPREIIVAP